MTIHEILESLRPYAADPPRGTPPEVLPRDLADPWSLNNAARGALGLLLAGEPPGPRLFAVADYLLAFNLEGYGAARDDDARLLNGTALALCGYLCGGTPPLHAEAELWRRAGCARLATQMHLRRAALDDRKAAACVLAVCRVADELDAPLLADLITLRERMWGRLVDHSRAERLAVSEDEYPRWMSDPVPADQVGALMADREWQWALEPPDYVRAPLAGQLDLAEADLACENTLTLRAHMLVHHRFGGAPGRAHVDWNLRLFDDVESTVSLNAQPFLRNLALAYAETGDAKYARCCAHLLWSWYRQSPLPNHWQPQGPWRTLEVGNRQANMWPVITACLGRTEALNEAAHAMLARSRLDHMHYALAYCGGPNNWYQVEAAGLATAALCSPELRHVEAALRVALRRLRWINGFAYYDDGFQFELTPGYHVFPTSSMFAVVLAARARGVRLPDDFVSLMERAHEMYLYAVQPNHWLPTLNDCSAIPVDPAPFLRRAAEAFGRPDLLWGGTHGAEGTPPDHASHAWPAAGYYVMRDRWDKDAQYLFFDGAPWGASHQHEDKLGFLLYAGGRLLLGDPNIYSYARTELTHYFRSSRAHNLVLIDGMGQARRAWPEARLSTLGRNEWQSTPEFDFVSSEYLEGYAPDPYQPDAPARGHPPAEVDTRFSQRRAIFYVKPGYWILCDRIDGPGDGDGSQDSRHTLEQLFHIAPIYEAGAAPPFRAGQVSVSPERIWTVDEGLSNLAILPVDGGPASAGLAVRAQKGETSPAVGWYGLLGEHPAWDVTLERRTTLPARMDAVLFPMAPGSDLHPWVERLLATPEASAFRITGAGLDDTFLLCEEDCGPVEVAGVRFEGRALLLRRRPTLQALSVGARSIVVDGTRLDG